jgi:hypothetical protein
MKRAQGRFLATLSRTKSKSQRKRWRGNKKQIFEEDTQHGELEKYNKHGWHEGSVDPDTGEIIKGPVRGRLIEV